MSRQVADLQVVLQQMVSEQRALLAQVTAQHEAMKKFDLKTMAGLVVQQEAARGKILALDTRRKLLIRQIAASAKLNEEPTLSRLAKLFPQQGPALEKLRLELRELIEKVSAKTYMSSRLSGAVLGHLNSVVRLLATVVSRAGIYTRDGTASLSSRIGVMDALG